MLEKPRKPIIHGRDHKGPAADGSPGGADAAVLNVDSTENVGADQGVHSVAAGGNVDSGKVLTADGSGGSAWLAAAAAASLPWAFSRKTVSLADWGGGARTDVDLDPATVDGDTDGSGVFTRGNGGSGTNGILINEAGLYLWGASAFAQTSGSPAAGSVISVLSNLDSGDVVAGDYYRPWYTVPQAGSPKNFDVALCEIWNADAGLGYTFPWKATVSVLQNSGLTLSTLVTFFIVRLSTVTSVNFG